MVYLCQTTQFSFTKLHNTLTVIQFVKFDQIFFHKAADVEAACFTKITYDFRERVEEERLADYSGRLLQLLLLSESIRNTRCSGWCDTVARWHRFPINLYNNAFTAARALSPALLSRSRDYSCWCRDYENQSRYD